MYFSIKTKPKVCFASVAIIEINLYLIWVVLKIICKLSHCKGQLRSGLWKEFKIIAIDFTTHSGCAIGLWLVYVEQKVSSIQAFTLLLVPDVVPRSDGGGITAIALYDYEAADDDELSFDPNDIICDIEKVAHCMWLRCL